MSALGGEQRLVAKGGLFNLPAFPQTATGLSIGSVDKGVAIPNIRRQGQDLHCPLYRWATKTDPTGL